MLMQRVEVIGILLSVLAPLTALFIYMFNSLKGDIRDATANIEKLFKARLKAELAPVNEKLGNHITGTNKQIAKLEQRQKEIHDKVAKLGQGQKAIFEKLDVINKSV